MAHFVNENPVMYTFLKGLLSCLSPTENSGDSRKSGLVFWCESVPRRDMQQILVIVIVAVGRRVVENDGGRREAGLESLSFDLIHEGVSQSNELSHNCSLRRGILGRRSRSLGARVCGQGYENTNGHQADMKTARHPAIVTNPTTRIYPTRDRKLPDCRRGGGWRRGTAHSRARPPSRLPG